MGFHGRLYQDCNTGIIVLAVIGVISFLVAFYLYPGTLRINASRLRCIPIKYE